MKVLWFKTARHDLLELRQYTAQHNPGAAHGVAVRIRAAVRTLMDHPQLGRVGRIEGTRELVVPQTPFIVAYRTAPGEIHVLAVIHGARQWPDRFVKN
jgi:toxin ParE1/3/4